MMKRQKMTNAVSSLFSYVVVHDQHVVDDHGSHVH